MRRVYVVVSLLALFALVAGAAVAKKPKKPVPHKQTAKNLPVVPGSRYLALGDSVTFGYMEPSVTPAPDYHNASSFPGYPGQVGRALRLKVANAACSGETSASLINPKAQSNGCENSPGHPTTGYRTTYPLHVKYSGSQLAYGVSYLKSHRNVRLVSLMIGANDYFVCVETTKDSCTSSSEMNAVAAAVEKNVRTILSAIRNRAHYRGQIVIVNYYSLDYGNSADNAVTQYLNHNQDTAAKPFGVKFADGFGELEAASVHSGNNTCTAGLLTQTGSGKCGIHPSYAGQALLAQAVENAIKLA